MLKLFKNMKKEDWICILFSTVFIVIQVWLDLKLPDYMSDITVLVETKNSTMQDILIAGGKMLGCALGSLLSSVIVSCFAAKIATDFGAILRRKIFAKVQSFSMEEIGGFSTSSLITRSTNDVMQVQMLIVMGLQVLVKAPITAVWAILKIYKKSWQWTAATGVAVIVLFALVITFITIAMPKFKKMQVLTDNLNRVTRENLTGLNVVRAYNAEAYQEAKFDQANEELTETNLFANRVMSFLMPSIQLIMNGLSLAIYWIGAYLIHGSTLGGKLTLFSDMVVFSSYAMQIVMAFMMLVAIFFILPRAQVAANRIIEVLETEQSIVDGKGTKVYDACKGEIVFDHVSFKYPDAQEYVLKDISFVAHKGETIAFIGATGCGKSTIINLVPRFYDVTDGAVYVDGVNVKDYKQAELRNRIGYVSQKAILFKGTIKSNVAYGDNGMAGASGADVVEAVYTAQANEFVDKLDDGYDSYVAQGGSNFSGGQKQRLSIARAICRHPEIFIFDDSFSALDYKTDKVLRQALKKDCKDATKLIVAQRIGTIIDADRIIVLENGEIAGMGTHDELMENCAVYQEIAYSQLSKEELA